MPLDLRDFPALRRLELDASFLKKARRCGVIQLEEDAHQSFLSKMRESSRLARCLPVQLRKVTILFNRPDHVVKQLPNSAFVGVMHWEFERLAPYFVGAFRDCHVLLVEEKHVCDRDESEDRLGCREGGEEMLCTLDYERKCILRKLGVTVEAWVQKDRKR
tara:strand:- start:2143 stop:2625 length:483 start_codon:yes stop_codon:yes gene_type:complete